jgi:hypothetical protein
MFRAFSRPSSGAQWLQWRPLVIPSYRGDGRAMKWPEFSVSCGWNILYFFRNETWQIPYQSEWLWTGQWEDHIRVVFFSDSLFSVWVILGFFFLFLLLLLLCCIVPLEELVYFLFIPFFESRLISTFNFVLGLPTWAGWGCDLFYTLFASLPLLVGILFIIRGLRVYCVSGIMRPEREAGHTDQLSAQVKCLDKVMLTYVFTFTLFAEAWSAHTNWLRGLFTVGVIGVVSRTCFAEVRVFFCT